MSWAIQPLFSDVLAQLFSGFSKAILLHLTKLVLEVSPKTNTNWVNWVIYQPTLAQNLFSIIYGIVSQMVGRDPALGHESKLLGHQNIFI